MHKGGNVSIMALLQYLYVLENRGLSWACYVQRLLPLSLPSLMLLAPSAPRRHRLLTLHCTGLQPAAGHSLNSWKRQLSVTSEHSSNSPTFGVCDKRWHSANCPKRPFSCLPQYAQIYEPTEKIDCLKLIDHKETKIGT